MDLTKYDELKNYVRNACSKIVQNILSDPKLDKDIINIIYCSLDRTCIPSKETAKEYYNEVCLMLTSSAWASDHDEKITIDGNYWKCKITMVNMTEQQYNNFHFIKNFPKKDDDPR
jgi:hypothetical protein